MKNSPFQPKIIYWLVIASIWSASVNLPSVSAAKSEDAFLDVKDTSNLQQTANVVFAVIGDYGQASQNEADVANLVKSWNPNFIVTVGDNNYEKGLAETIDQNIGQYYHDYIFRYNGKYGSGSSTNRFFPALGNHDWGNNGIKPYLEYFTLPGNERYYDFIGGSIHFFILDSDPNEPDETTVTSKQARWLKNGLAASTSPFDIVIMHHPAYSSGAHGSNSYMQWPFKTWGADAVLSGHDHLYERLLVGDLPYFVNGLGGDSLYNFGSTVSGSQIRFNQDYGAMRVESNSTYIKFQFFTRANILIDEYTLSKSVPTITSIVRVNSKPTNAASIDYVVNFSESVNGVDASDFLLTLNGISNASVSNVSGSNAAYTVSINTGTGNGTLRLDLSDNDSIVDAEGNTLGGAGAGNGNFSNAEFYTIDKGTPSVTSIVRASPSPSGTASVDFIVNFSEPVIGLDISDFALNTSNINNPFIANLSGLDSSYVVTVNTGNGTGSIRLDLIDDDSVTDFSGNKLGGLLAGNGNFVNGEIYSIEKSIPSVLSITRTSPNPSNTSSVDFMVTFSESVTGVDIADFNLLTTGINNASLSAVNGSANIYIISANTGVGDGSIRLDLIDNDSIINGTGSPLGDIGSSNFINGETYTIDKTAPIITSIVRSGANPSTAPSVDFIVSFSEPVTGVEGTDFHLNPINISSAFINHVSPSGPFYIVNVNTGNESGSIRLDLTDDDSITDLAGNKLGGDGAGNGNYINGETYDVEKSAPSITSIISASPNPSSAATVDFIVTFSESVTGVDVSDFSLSVTNIINASVVNINNMDPFYIVTVNTGAGTGTIRLDFLDNDSITDISGNKPGGEGLGNGNFSSGENITISKSPVNFPPPTLREPKKSFLTNNSNPSFSWTKIRDASAYEIVIARDSNFTQIVTSQIINGVNYTNTTPLTDGVYYWYVRAYSPKFEPGKFSASNSFVVDTTPPTAPNLSSPANNTNVRARLKFSWAKVPDATRYQIEVDNNADFSSPEWSSLRQESNYQVFTIRSGVYYWHVRAKDMAGNWSIWSTPYSINIP